MSARLATGLIASAVLGACAVRSASPAPSSLPQTPVPSAAPSAAASPTAAPLPAGTIRFMVATDKSLATIRVHEQVAGVALPSDAVVTTSAFQGELVLLPDGALAEGSLISADLDALKSDSDLRDEWIKINTLQTRRFPRAEFIASRIRGIPLPLPSAGEWQAQLEGTMRIHGTEKALTWDLLVTRSPGEVHARGRTIFQFGDYGMAVPANRLILSVVDEVRLEIDVVARDAP